MLDKSILKELLRLKVKVQGKTKDVVAAAATVGKLITQGIQKLWPKTWNWPWPSNLPQLWSYDLDMLSWSIYLEDIPAYQWWNSYLKAFQSCSLKLENDLDLQIVLTLICKLDLDIFKIYLYTKNERCSSRHSKVIAQNLKLTMTLKLTLTLTLWH